MTASSPPKYAVIDASALIGFCATEPDKYAKVHAALQQYQVDGTILYAPHLIVMEALFVLCKKLQEGILAATDHALTLASLQSMLSVMLHTPNGDASLIARAETFRSGYGCSRSADTLYLALAEELSKQGQVELLTFDTGQEAMAVQYLPQITVQLLTV